jgi:tetratricopeptide (TPR) repeat protein
LLSGSSTGTNSRPVRVEPRDDVDAFFIGVVHVFIGRHKTDLLTMAIGRLGPKDFDFDTPLSTALSSLRRAVQADPEQYWAWFMLGRALLHEGTDPAGAELAFTTCVLLRPDYSRGYEHRALALVLQSLKTKDPALRENLLARASRDSTRAEELAPFEPSTWWVRGEMARHLGRDKQALVDYSHALLLEEQLSERASRRNLLSGVRATVSRVRAANRDNPDARALLALILMETKKDGPKRALTDLAAVLRDHPNHPLALLARGRALERLGQWSKALAAYDSVTKTESRWQQVERQQGRQRALLRLDRTEEAHQARRQAEQLDGRLRKP